MTKTWNAIGMMSGTSMDGLDVVLIKAKQTDETFSTELIEHVYVAYPKDMVEWIREIVKNDSMIESHYFGCAWADFAAKAVQRVLQKSGVAASKIDVVGAHGQTLFHAPKPISKHGRKIGITIQAGDFSRLATQIGIPVVGNFRTADVAVGGQGAPLVPHAHKLLFGARAASLAVQNIGGIGNVTVLKGGNVALAFDTGPGNIWLDMILRWHTDGKKLFDPEGKAARSGSFYIELYKKLLDHPYFLQRPPKSTGWETFGESHLNKWKRSILSMNVEDALHTAVYATADSMLHAYERYVFPKYKPAELIVCGGGAKNKFLMDVLRERFSMTEVLASDEVGVPCDQVEAVSFALLAVQTLRRETNNEPTATGAKRKVVCGQISYP